MLFYILIQCWPANSNQPGKIRYRNIPIFPHWIILLKASRYLPRRSAHRSAGLGAVNFSFGHAFPDPLHRQLALHLSHGAQDDQRGLKHVILAIGIELLLEKQTVRYEQQTLQALCSFSRR